MSIELHRHRSGLIYSQEFAEYLRKLKTEEQSSHPSDVPHLDYLRCSEGELAGQSWWQLGWINGMHAPAEHRYDISGVEVFIHRQTMRGLKNHMLHFDGQRVVVRS